MLEYGTLLLLDRRLFELKLVAPFYGMYIAKAHLTATAAEPLASNIDLSPNETKL